ncbi:MAG: 23S rRNA (guanosine(2251)-2'-O)-methyltransferase RlmB [Bacteroidales bacterium]|nr:23S rRNA (guanosine(2251)-2'-O)-methyltransferase RlmB [Bacteroidales bacterium]
MAKTSNIVYGLRPVIEALSSNQRVDRILMQSGLQGALVGELKNLIRTTGVPVQIVPVEKLNRMTTGNHQGVIATLTTVDYHSFIDIMERLQECEKTPFLLLLDHITDVRNMGAIVRTAECAGVDAVVIPDHGSAQLNEDAVKSSSGALLRLPICRESNLKTVLNLAKQYGLTVVAATEKGSTPYTKVDFTQPTLLIMGAEETGISPELLKMSTQRAAIPIRGDIQSLNVSVAAGIMIYEAMRQRGL